MHNIMQSHHEDADAELGDMHVPLRASEQQLIDDADHRSDTRISVGSRTSTSRNSRTRKSYTITKEEKDEIENTKGQKNKSCCFSLNINANTCGQKSWLTIALLVVVFSYFAT